MEKTFGNKRDYNAMIRTLYEVQQKEDKTVEEYMLCIHDAVAVICSTYPERLPDYGRDLKKDRFYHGLCPYLHDALSFAMAELPEREQAHPMFDTAGVGTLLHPKIRHLSREAEVLPCANRKGGGPGGRGSGIGQSHIWGGL